MEDVVYRPARGLVPAVGVGGLLGLAAGVACMALGVGGRGPESGLWLFLMPLVGLAEGLVAGLLAHGAAAARIRPAPLRVVVVAAATLGTSSGLGRLLLDGFDLVGVEGILAVAVGGVVAALWPRWTAGGAPRPRRRAAVLPPAS